jgi:hypothetical protein
VLIIYSNALDISECGRKEAILSKKIKLHYTGAIVAHEWFIKTSFSLKFPFTLSYYKLTKKFTLKSEFYFSCLIWFNGNFKEHDSFDIFLHLVKKYLTKFKIKETTPCIASIIIMSLFILVA